MKTLFSQHSTIRLAALTCVLNAGLSAARAELPAHNIAAVSVTVVQNDALNNATSVTVTPTLTINDFRIRTGSNRGDYNVQIGPDFSDDVAGGVIMSSSAENGRDSGEGTGTNYITTAIDANAAGYWVPVFNSPLGAEYNVNFSAAYFPYTNWLGGWARNAGGVNGGANDLLTSSPGLALGTNFVDNGSGKSTVDLRSFGYNSQTDGVLLVTGGKNEDNYALSTANANGTWSVFVKDNGSSGASYEQDYVAFVFVPRSNTNVISGKFQGNGSILMSSGPSPRFAITNTGVGTWRLTIPGFTPATGVLIISAEGGNTVDNDNILSFQPDNDGWIIQSRDIVSATAATVLETPTLEPVASFVFIPGPTPGFTVTPTNNLLTTESGGTADFSVVLQTKPTDAVTIPVSSSNPAEGTPSVSSLLFTVDNWNVPQTVTVTGQDDAVIDGSVTYSIILSPATSTDTNYNGMNPSDVTLVNADNEGGVTVAPSSGLFTTEAGGQASFAVHLNTPPGADVTVGFSSGNTNEGTVSPASLVFTTDNWNVDQTVTITGVDDFVDDGDITYTINTALSVSTDPTYNGLKGADVTVINRDNDTAGVSIPTPVDGLVLREGSSTNYSVVLTSQPTADVHIAVSFTDHSGGSIAPTNLTFASSNWNVAQIVTVSAENLTADGTLNYTVTNVITSGDPVYAALAPISFTVIVLDNEAALTLPAGGLIYGIGMPGLGIDGRASIVDPFTANYGGVTLRVTLTTNAASDDLLEIRNTGSGPGQIGVAGSAVSYEGSPIATFSGGTGATPLTVTFNGTATPLAAQALLRSVTFRNSNSAPSINSRAVSVLLTHADGGISTASTSVRVGLLRGIDFQEGADFGYGAYTGQADAALLEATPNTPSPAGGAGGLFIDWPTIGSHNSSQILLRFDTLFGDSFGQIPTNAVIVSAKLILHITDAGDGSPLYRMLVPWDATNVTWNSMNAGIDTDDTDAHSTFDSQIGVADGTGSTGTGSITVSVLPDILAWKNGEVNNGWALPGWPNNTDGTVFSPSESTNIADRPRLQIDWVPAGTAVATFRQGVNGYTNDFDTRIRQNAPDANFATVVTAFCDYAVTGTSDPENVLMRFDNILGANPGQVPPGARIDAAELDLSSIVSNGMGHGGHIHSLLQDWTDTTATWNSWGGGIQADGVKALAAATATIGTAALTPLAQGAFHTFEVTSDVQAWSSGVRSNYGWCFLPWTGGTDGWGISMAETTDERSRPQLRVYYTPGPANNNIVLLPLVRTASSVTIHFSATVGNTYSVQRADAVNGPWNTLGTATVGGDGTASYLDNAPLATNAFYRVSYP